MTHPVADFELFMGMNTEALLYRVKKDYIIRFRLTESLIGKPVRFFTNYPVIEEEKFQRAKYYELSITPAKPTLQKLDRFCDYFVLGPIQHSGAFHFGFTTDNSTFKPELSDNKDFQLFGGQGYFVVESHFSVGDPDDLENAARHSQWDLEGVLVQTYLAKNLGVFSEWRDRLRTAFESGYNMIHFSPLQELGVSTSGYSLKDQLKINPNFSEKTAIKKYGWEDIDELVRYMETEWSVLSMTDLVLNHTAINSPWIKDHPECVFNLENSPHLVPAFIIDFTVWRMTQLCAQDKLQHKHIPSNLNKSDTHVAAVRNYLLEELKALRLHEFFQADVAAVQEEFKQWLASGSNQAPYAGKDNCLVLRIVGSRAGRRFGATVDFKMAKEIFGHDTPDVAAHNLGNRLGDLNRNIEEVAMHNLWCAIDCIANGVRYRFFDPNGPLLKNVSEATPFVDRYFLCPENNLETAADAEKLALSDQAKFIMACNGWVMNADPLKNFAEVDSNVYFRRELVVWADSVKLRYGERPEDCPYLWDRMLEYAKKTAKIFHGVRLDNCHSTPLNVAQAVLDACRDVRPGIYILAELFTGSEGTDNIFLNKLGISSLVREALSAYDCHDQGRMVHRFGGLHPAGGFPHAILKRRMIPTAPHALFCDQTHDNPAPASKRTIFDQLPSAALVAMSACSTGSVRGYDELVPYQIDVVTEKRVYASWDKEITSSTGMIRAKAALNKLHRWMAANNFHETFVDQVDTNVVAVTRFSSDTAESVVMVTHSCFFDKSPHPAHHSFRRITLNGRVRRILIEARTANHSLGNPMEDFKWDDCIINGLTNVTIEMKEDIEVSKSKMFKVIHLEDSGGTDVLEFFDFPPGCIVAVSVCLNDLQSEALSRVRGALLHQFGRRIRSLDGRKASAAGATVAIADTLLPVFPDSVDHGLIKRLVSELSLTDINWLMYRCDHEENVPGIGRKPFYVPGFGDFVFCGFQGVVSVMRRVAEYNDLGHPICDHLRQGLWLLTYLYDRLAATDSSMPSRQLDTLSRALKELFQPINNLPKYLVPASFGMLVGCLYQTVMDEVGNRLGKWTQLGSSTVRNLVSASLQLYGKAPCVRLPDIMPAPALTGRDDNPDRYACSLAAGLPHFAEGMWRGWGRDTFIALRGCLLLTDRFEEAATTILQFAGLMRHGLIPNLMGDGMRVAPRYNARDAVWWWLYAICCFEDTIAASEGTPVGGSKKSILGRPVFRWFPNDDAGGWPEERDTFDMKSPPADRVMPLYDVVQEALQRHAKGFEFRERNAGHQLDCQMVTEGFNVGASVEEKTGFISGGNPHNCGTWMDKMGSSERAGNRGKPATPRNGCAVELTGLAYACISWLERAHKANATYYPHGGVKTANGAAWGWADWATKIRNNFEGHFWLPEQPNEFAGDIRQGYYKDVLHCPDAHAESQLRPNFLVTMTVAPDLFNPQNAWKALELVGKQLVGPLGIKTLDPRDRNYRCAYNNSDDSNDFSIAQGFNYHQGPEWLWLTGFYIRARLMFAQRLVDLDKANLHVRGEAVHEAQEILLRLNNHLRDSPWRSLPELTQANGEFCPGSCPSQAWSVGTAIEAIYDLLHVNAPELDYLPTVRGKTSEQSHDVSVAAAPATTVYPGGPRITDPNLFAAGSQGAASVRVSLYNDQLRIMCNVS